MRIGLQLPTYWQDYGAGDVRTAVTEAARAADAHGYDSVWCNDHIISGADVPAMGYLLEPLITLASVIHLAPRLTLGTSVLVLPQRNALLVAKQVAALDVLSGGKMILGVGVGWNAPEFAMLNTDFARRGEIGDEAIDVMRTLWRESSARHTGTHYRFEDAVFYPKPTRGEVPIWIGGNTPSAVRRAARLGDGWCPYGVTLDEFRARVALLRAQPPGRTTPGVAAHLMLYLGNAPRGHVHGTPDQVAATLRAYQAAGMESLICGFEADGLEDYLRQVQTFAEQVRPQLAG